MREFLLRIKYIVDALGSCGDPVLPVNTMISVIESKFKPLPIGEVEALLLAHEARMKKF